MTLKLTPIPILQDNYAWRLQDEETGAVAIVDPADADAVAKALDAAGGRLDLVLLTHHHADHIAGAEAIARRYGVPIAGAAEDAARLPPLDLALRDGDSVRLGASVGEVIATPGHTRFHISYFFPAEAPGQPVLLCGDTLFSLGCGRLLEGTASDMFDSLRRLSRLPDDTLVACGHEYTQSNARFALSVDAGNEALSRRAADVAAMRRDGTPSVPVALSVERATNPFLRATDLDRFSALRSAKDTF